MLCKMPNMVIGEKISALCDARGWGRYHLLNAVPRVSKSKIDNWFRGKTRPTLADALHLARFFVVPLDWLADDKADMPPPTTEGLASVLTLVQRMGVDEALDRLAGIGKASVQPQSVPMGREAGAEYKSEEELRRINAGAYRNATPAETTPRPATPRRKGNR